MARRSLLIAEEEPEVVAPVTEPVRPIEPRKRSSRIHIGAYYPRGDQTIIAFQQLAFEIEKTQQEMLYEAIGDYLAKVKAGRAFR
jgi:hypothetical protein